MVEKDTIRYQGVDYALLTVSYAREPYEHQSNLLLGFNWDADLYLDAHLSQRRINLLLQVIAVYPNVLMRVELAGRFDTEYYYAIVKRDGVDLFRLSPDKGSSATSRIICFDAELIIDPQSIDTIKKLNWLVDEC